MTWAPFQYPIRRLIVRSREVSKQRDLYLELSDRSEIWLAHRQHCCRCAYQIKKWCYNLNYQSRGLETSSYDKTSYRMVKRGHGRSSQKQQVMRKVQTWHDVFLFAHPLYDFLYVRKQHLSNWICMYIFCFKNFWLFLKDIYSFVIWKVHFINNICIIYITHISCRMVLEFLKFATANEFVMYICNIGIRIALNIHW